MTIIMKVLSLFSVIYLFFNVNLIHGANFDGQYSCIFGKTRSKRWSLTKFIASSSVSVEDVKFYLYNKEQYDKKFDSVEILPNKEYLLQYGDFDASKLTKIIIHGYKSERDGSASSLIREDSFFKNGDFNIIVVDWNAAQHKFGVLWPYDAVVKKLDAVGEHVSNMLHFLENNGLDLSTTTVVGHSLGSHVAGIASHKLGSKIGRIVGLDPAGPLMSTGNDDRRLSKDDAVQVEVIHSEIEQCGLKKQMGHYDFYPNSGLGQPGCDTLHCSHSRSYKYFAESLDPNSRGFYGRLCEDWWSMQDGKCNGKVLLMGGLYTKSEEHGIYYVKTNAEPPYAQGRDALSSKRL